MVVVLVLDFLLLLGLLGKTLQKLSRLATGCPSSPIVLARLESLPIYPEYRRTDEPLTCFYKIYRQTNNAKEKTMR